MGYLTLCICYTWDLNKTIVNPLYPAKKRMRWYLVWVVLSLVLLLGFEGIYFVTLHPTSQDIDTGIPDAEFLRLATF